MNPRPTLSTPSAKPISPRRGLGAALRRALTTKATFALALTCIAFSSTYASAATLGASNTVLSAGNAAPTSCTNSVNADYDVAYDANLHGYRINELHLTGLSGCAGQTISATFSDANNAAQYELTATILPADAAANTRTIPITSPLEVGTVTGISIAVAG